MTNEEAIGYAILTLKSLGASKDFIEKFENEIKRQMDEKTPEQAKKAFMEA